MARWVVVATLEDLWDGGMLSVTLDGGGEVLLCNVEGAVLAYDNSCPHLGNRLSNGKLEEYVLVCAAHEWSFDVRSGGGINPARACLQPYPVRLDADRILIDTQAVANERRG
jgi:toluene monooxygenase system ferredoxin subunit